MENNKSLFFTEGEPLDSYSLRNQFAENMEFRLVKDRRSASDEDYYYALALAVKDRLVRKWLRTQEVYQEKNTKRVYYLSLEFLMGRLLGNALHNMDYYEECREIIKQDNLVLEDIIDLEKDMGLGNGGLGRLAACFLDSMATLQLPAFGYGIRYEYGIFRQDINNGYQIEQPDHWLAYGNPWESFRRKLSYRIKFYGEVEHNYDEKGRIYYDWKNTQDILAVAYDIPIPGYRSDTVNNLRLWSARSTDEFSFEEFNKGNYLKSVESKAFSENISKVLYPNDSSAQGKKLRLQQEYFFVSASLQDIIRKFKFSNDSILKFHEKTAIQLNDTHPAIAIPELMRILLDEYMLTWEDAWNITTNTFSYTNHTVVPEALEEWSVEILGTLLPRHLQIIYEINQRFLEMVKANFTNDSEIIRELSLVRENPKTIRMANLSIVASHKVNGVAALHTEILKSRVFPYFHKIFPNKFVNVTNGITQRRWLKSANPLLSELITDNIGSQWITNLDELKKLENLADNREFQENWMNIKWTNKRFLKEYIEKEHQIEVNLDSVFDVQIKRIHEYKRQLLNLFHVITRYNEIKANPLANFVPRTVIFGGKAAPAYTIAKMIIKMINSVAEIVNNDPEVGDKLKVVFLKNYSVSLAEKIIPAADLSEQISTAGFEASGTGNMKFALNGALTIGTMDGANIEISEEVGEDNIFIFGLLDNEVVELKNNNYIPENLYFTNPSLKKVIDMLRDNYFSRKEKGIFQEIIDGLLKVDYYCLFADYQSYIDKQKEVDSLFIDKTGWAKKSILNSARIGKFSTDRSIQDYNRLIWNVEKIDIPYEK